MDIKESLASVARYNGWHNVLVRIKHHLIDERMKYHKDEYWSITKPKFLNEFDIDSYPNVIWFIMVEMFGDCGCSPRYGWINSSTSKDAIEFVSYLCDESRDDEDLCD